MILRGENDTAWLFGVTETSGYLSCELGYFVAPTPRKLRLYNIDFSELIYTVILPTDIYRSNFNSKVFDIMLVKEKSNAV